MIRWLALVGALCSASVSSFAFEPDVSFETQVWEVFAGGPGALSTYARLEERYSKLSPEEQRAKAQLLATADTIYGDYESAEERNRRAFGPLKLGSCPASARGVLASEAVEDVADNADALLFNEVHTRPATRAFVEELLPSLWQRGYRMLALEALFPASGSEVETAAGLPHADTGLYARGEGVDDAKAGIYLREPRFGALVRSAIGLGFDLVAYDPPDANGRDEREQSQADTLGILIASGKGKMVVLSGGSHIWKSDGWMADRLAIQHPELNVISIDSASQNFGCLGENGQTLPANGENALAFKFDNRGYWSANPSRTDMTIFMNFNPSREAGSKWFTSKGKAIPVRFERACSGDGVCAIEARPAGRPQSVPVDRTLLRESDATAHLFLPPADYVIRFAGPHSERSALLIVR